MKRINSYRNTMVFSASVVIGLVCSSVLAEEKKPNMILMMCDDLGYGDVGFNGNTVIKTPHLDAMAKEGANLTHFYAAGPVCSPTRGTFVTGRHYFRYGIFGANVGHLGDIFPNFLAQLLDVLFGLHFGTLLGRGRRQRRGLLLKQNPNLRHTLAPYTHHACQHLDGVRRILRLTPLPPAPVVIAGSKY